MAEIIMVIAALLLALYGCVELIRHLVSRILRPLSSGRSGRSGVLVLPLSGHREDVEYLIQAAAVRGRWAADLAETTLLLDTGMDEETLAIARRLCERYDGVCIGCAGDVERLIRE